MTVPLKPPAAGNKPSAPFSQLGSRASGAGAAPSAPTEVESRSATELVSLAIEPGVFAFYRWNDIAINVWASQPTGDAVEVLAQLTERSVSECPNGLASIHWLDQGVALPTAEARHGLAEIAKRYERHLMCVGVLLQGSGFWASATRSALTGIMLLAPRTFSLRFFGEAPELSALIVRERARRARTAVEPERLTRVVGEAVRDFVPARSG
jgi:predicted nucleic acid-binding Zn ribbon protein